MANFIEWLGKLGCGFICMSIVVGTLLVLTKPKEEDLIKGACKDLIGVEFVGPPAAWLLQKFGGVKLEREDLFICSVLVVVTKDGERKQVALGVFGKVFGPNQLKKFGRTVAGNLDDLKKWLEQRRRERAKQNQENQRQTQETEILTDGIIERR